LDRNKFYYFSWTENCQSVVSRFVSDLMEGEVVKTNFEERLEVSNAIYDENIEVLAELIKKGIVSVNDKYENPIGCVSLFHDL
jgi:hypothetical protein